MIVDVTLVSEIPRQVVVFEEMSKFLHMAKYDVLQAQASFMKLKVLKTCHKIVTEFHSQQGSSKTTDKLT